MRKILLLSALSLMGVTGVSTAQQPMVLAEVFSNINCGNCKIQDGPFDDYLLDKPNIVLINYHNANTDPNDKFFLVARQGRSDLYRTQLYNFSADPAASINGKVSGQSAQLWEADCDKATQVPPLSVNAYKMADGLIYIHVKSILALSSAQRLNVALVESKILFTNTEAYGCPPGCIWDNMFRKMLPTPDGFLFTPTGSDEYTYSFDPTQDDVNLDTWNPDNMQAVAWLQDDQGATKKVEALGVVSLANLSTGGVAATDAKSQSLRVIGNPAKSACQFWITLPAAAHVRLTLSDMLGREVRLLSDQRFPEGQTSVEMDGTAIAAGCYVVRMFVDGAEVDHAKLVIE